MFSVIDYSDYLKWLKELESHVWGQDADEDSFYERVEEEVLRYESEHLDAEYI